MKTRSLAAAATAAALIAAVLVAEGPAAEAASLNGHTVVLDGTGKIIPWTPNPADGYGTVVDLASNYFVTSVPNNANNGKRGFYSTSYMNPDTQQLVSWPHNPAGLYAMITESALKYYAYSGNAALVNEAQALVTWHLDHGMTAASDAWASVPYASGDTGSLTYDGASSGNTTGVGDGDGVIEPDKLGELGYAMVQLYEFTGNTRYRDAAIQAANVLAAKVRTGSSTQSPWPFRVVAKTGVIKEQYTAHVISPIQLFDELIRLQLGQTAAYQTARQTAWTWLMTYPMQNNTWSNYFEDVAIQNDLGNLNQLNALMVARYLLEHPELDASWEQHVRGIIAWVESTFRVTAYGANTIKEQTAFAYPMGSHTSRYASVNALLYARTGDAAAKEKAYRAFNWATYMARSNGVVIDGPEVGNQWFTDGYGDYIRHFLTGMGAVPEWAPAAQNHLTGSTSIVKAISYTSGGISYTTVDNASTESFRLDYIPTDVTAGGVPLSHVSTLSTEGWTFDQTTGVLRVRHDAAASVQIGGGTPINQLPSVSITSPASGATFTEPATITVTATASDVDGSVTKVEFFNGSAALGTDTVAPYSVDWANVTSGTYQLTACATDDGAVVTTSDPVNLTVSPVGPPPPPSQWLDVDVGSVGQAGSSSNVSGTYTVRGSGGDIWGTADAFHFVYQSLSGDGEITARVASVQNTNEWAMAGVMIRDGLGANAKHADVSVSPAHGSSLTWRSATGGSSSYQAGPVGAAPRWVRLKRLGSTFTASGSSNGTTWTVIGTTTITMNQNVYVGLAVSAVNNAALNTSTYTNITIPASSPADTTAPVISNIAVSGVNQNGSNVSWTTDEPADTQVEYGTTAAYGLSTSLNAGLTTSHTQVVSGLNAGVTYHYRVKSRDAAGNLRMSTDQTFTTSPAGDTTAPVISNITVSSINQNGANVSWTTDEPADTQVEYGTTAAYGLSTSLNTSLTTSHTQVVSGLNAGMTYHYRVKSRDAAGNLRMSNDQTFATPAPPDTTAPGAPANLTASAVSNRVDLTWTAAQDNVAVTGYLVYRDNVQIATASANSYSDATVAGSTTYAYRVVAVDAAGNRSGDSNTVTVLTPAPSQWLDVDVGSVGQAGSSSNVSGTYTVRGSGGDIWGTADAFHFVYQSLSGDGEITARVASVQNTNEWAMAGVMIRDGLGANAKHADVSVSPAHGSSLTWRSATGGSSSYQAGPVGAAPRWVRLKRLGSTFTASGSSNGTTWTVIGTTTITMNQNVYVGLAVSAVNNAALNTSTYTNITIQRS